jgi:hypothetical protein
VPALLGEKMGLKEIAACLGISRVQSECKLLTGGVAQAAFQTDASFLHLCLPRIRFLSRTSPLGISAQQPLHHMAIEPASIMREVHVTSIPDICLILPSGELKIFANVAVLRNASPVFHAMLGPDYLEGQAIKNAESTPEIDLPDDDATPMLLLMQILHMRFGELRNAVAHHEFLIDSVRDTAILADKYDVCQAMSVSFHVLARLDRVPEMEDMGDLWSILSASYIVGNRDAFRASSARLIMYCNVAYSTVVFTISRTGGFQTGGMPRLADMSICSQLFAQPPLEPVLTGNKVMLEEKRARTRAKVSEMFQKDIQRLFSWVKEDIDSYMPRLSYSHSLDTTLNDLTDIINELSPGPFDYKDLLKGTVEMLEETGQLGLCFDCVGYGVIEDHECT